MKTKNIIEINKRNNTRNIYKENKFLKTKNNKNNTKFKYINNSTNIKIMIYIILLFIAIYLTKKPIPINKRKLNYVSEIVITISGSGEQSILSDGYSYLPSEVYINEEKQNQILKKYDLSLTENTVRMVWNSLLTNCSNMFYGVTNAIKIDFSKFDSSNVINMYKMFYRCSKLQEINFDNFDTTKVTTMEYLFYECDSLISLNLSSFSTPELTNTAYMFNDCDNLISVDLSNLITSKVTNMNGMFGWCVSLISVDLSNFDISLVETMNSFFYKCRKLLFVNLNSFKEKNGISVDTMVEDVPNDLIYCINGEQSPKILANLKTINSNNDCSNNCFSKSMTLNLDERKCENQIQCSKYLYNNTCYEECPKRTKISSDNEQMCVDLNCSKYYNYEQNECIDEIEDGYYLNDTNIKTIDKCHSDCKTCKIKESSNNSNCISCPNDKYFDSGNCLSSCINGFYKDSLNNNICKCKYNIKCKECSSESIKYDLCINCNDNYYQKFNDSSNILSFINCYNYLDGYYLDNNIYKPCYFNCKKCNEYGDENNNKCIECNDNYIFINDSKIASNCYQKCEYYYYFDQNNEYHCTSNNECPEDYKLIKEKNKCINNCINDSDYKFEYNNSCYKYCPEGTLINNYICEDKKIYDNNIYSTNIYSSNIFDNNIYSSNIYDNSIYSTNIYENNIYNTNIYDNNIYNTYNTNINNNNIYNTSIYDNNNIYDNNIPDNNISECNPINLFKGECSTINVNSSFKDNMIINIQKSIQNGNLNSLLLKDTNDTFTDLLIKDNDILYHITTSSQDQDSLEYKNVTTVQLGKCEDVLREHYNINNNISLLIFLIEISEKTLNMPIIEYEIYNFETNEKLDLEYCNETKIKLSIPVNINEDILFKYNTTSEYYNDKCNPYTTEEGTDIILKDRRNEYKDNNMALCENNCDLQGYNTTTQKAICECKLKTNITLFSNIVIDKEKLLNKFTDIKTSANLDPIKCYNILFTSEGLKYNIGSYFIILIILVHIVSIFLFIIKGFKYFKNLINKITTNKTEKTNNKTIKKKKKIKNESLISKNDIKNNNKINTKKIIVKNPNKKKKSKKKKIFKKINLQINILKTNDDISKITNSKTNNNLALKDINNNNLHNLNKINIGTLNNDTENIIFLKLNDYELNTLTYSEALKIDRRNFLQYYFSLLKTKHLVIFTFYTKTDYNSTLIKICLFFFSFGLYFTVNALFFNDSTIHKIYEDKGDFDIIYQIPQILYSNIISSFIDTIIKFFSLSEQNIIELKREKINIERKSKNILKCLKIKFFLYFLLSLILLFMFWYYLSCFCALYRNSQIHLVKDTFISFGLTLIYPLGLNLIPGILRMISLKSPDKDREYLYKISQIVQRI